MLGFGIIAIPTGFDGVGVRHHQQRSADLVAAAAGVRGTEGCPSLRCLRCVAAFQGLKMAAAAFCRPLCGSALASARSWPWMLSRQRKRSGRRAGGCILRWRSWAVPAPGLIPLAGLFAVESMRRLENYCCCVPPMDGEPLENHAMSPLAAYKAPIRASVQSLRSLCLAAGSF